MTDATPADRPSLYGPLCPVSVDRVAMFHRWDRLTFLHWKYDVDAVQRLLPNGLVVESYMGAAWVGLVPFFMEVRLPGLPAVPWLFKFAETNVRTYVRGPDGESGVWFFSLDAARLAAVITARISYRVPYFWSQMSVTRTNNTMRYSTRRRWPGLRNASSDVEITIGDRHSAEELTDFDHYLTARWILYGKWGSRLLMARAEHEPWELHRVIAAKCDDELIRAAGLPPPSGDPLVHWSPGVDVRVGYPKRISSL